MNRITSRKQVKEALEQKELILFGAGNYAKQFYRDFHETVKISYCISNNSNETSFFVDGKSVCPVARADSVAITENQIIVLCAERYQEMETQLRDMGYRNGVHYMNSGLVRLLLTEKKIAIFYGVCYMRAIYNCMIKSEEFHKNYEAFYWLDYQRMEPETYELFSFLLPLCDLFLYTACISYDKSQRNQAYLSRLSENCKIVGIPLVLFNGYHPRTEGVTGEENLYNVVSIKTHYGPFLIPDPNLNRMIGEGKTCSQVMKAVKEPSFYDKEWLKENFAGEIKKLKLAERLADIKITDFLLENHGKERLFLNETHIANPIIMELAKRTLEAISLEPELPEEQLRWERLLYTTEVPLYPSVIEHLELEIYKGDPQYRIFTFGSEVDVTFEEYIERYYAFCRSMKTWIEKGYFPE